MRFVVTRQSICHGRRHFRNPHEGNPPTSDLNKMLCQNDATATIVVSDPREFTSTRKWNNVAIDQHNANSSRNQHVDHDAIQLHLVAW